MTLSVKIKKDPRISLDIRRTLEGNVMIFDHEDIDIILMVEKKMCVTFPKGELTDRAYSAQDRMFRFLINRGVVDHESVRGGNLFGAFEGRMIESKLPGIDSLQATLYTINEYLTGEKPYFAKTAEEFDSDRLDHMLRPDDDESTELGDVPQAAEKGSMDSRVRPWGYMYSYSLIREEAEKEKREE